MRIFVGSLPYSTTEDELRKLFSAHGDVNEASVVKDRDTDRPRGFAFVEMPNEAEAKAAIQALNGTSLGGRAIAVNEAQPRPARTGGYGGGGRSSDRGGYGGGRY
jgi:RNA recognition motif-containing protein